MADVKLNTLDRVPEALYTARPEALEDLLGGPTLLHLPGRRPAPLFVSLLLHGNESTGLHALQRVLQSFGASTLPRALSVFIGNVAAARFGLRRLDGQPDYNRIWPGSPVTGCDEAAVLAEVVAQMQSRDVFASIDVHNNTGLNPHYACVNRLETPFLHLATLFARTVVYFTEPAGVQSAAFASLCPAVTVECGKPDSPGSATHAAEFISAALHLAEFPRHPIAAHDLDLYHTVATVKIPDTVTLSFDGEPADVMFVPELDHLNFRDLPAGTALAQVRDGHREPLWIPDADGGNRWRDFLQVRAGRLELTRALMPSMLSRDARVVRQDCLCYFMERLPLP
ncbi:MAG: peptidase M14 [Thiotrichales bacterium SG8_50]|nr:MAG: peptidase M14 [Thiotrichales bacterium SG8_50]